MDEQEVPEDSSEEISIDKSANNKGVQSKDSLTENDPAINEGELSITPEELPTMQWSDVYAELAEFEKNQSDADQQNQPSQEKRQTFAQTGSVEGFEEAMSWLEELAAGQGMPIDEMPTLVTNQPKPDSASEKEPASEALSDPLPDSPDIAMDSDPMAWLEQLAVDQSSPLEELPSVADRLLGSEIVSQTEIPSSSTINDPYDIDRALTYLEQLAVAQGIDLTNVSFDANQPVTSLSSALAIIDRLAIGLDPDPEPDLVPGVKTLDGDGSTEKVIDEEKETDQSISEDAAVEEISALDDWSDVSLNMPGDPQEALDWLGTLDKEQEPAKPEAVVEADTLATKGGKADQDRLDEVGEAKKEPLNDVDVLGEMPEDPDEAVAWMEELAARDFQQPLKKDDERLVEEEPLPASSTKLSSSSPETAVEPQEKAVESDLQGKIAKYQQLIDEESVSEEDVKALEAFIDNNGESPKLFRLLGDAYMQVGQTEKAIATYRKGFDHF